MEKIKNNNLAETKVASNLVVGENIIYPEKVNVIINDLKLGEKEKDNFRNLSKRNLVFLEPEVVFENLLKRLLQEGLLNDQKTAILYPANGGLLLKNMLNIDERNMEYIVGASRDIDLMPMISLPGELINNLKNNKISTILVLDDVIVNGSTLKAVQDEVYIQTNIVDDSMSNQGGRFSWDSSLTKRLNLKWVAGSLMTSERRRKDEKKQNENLKSFEKVFTQIYYRGESGYVPVNSISTWVYDKNKGDTVLLNYANNYTKNPDEFINYVKSLNVKGDKL